jgi:DNA-directed RNA polymerase subunit RPC12/RpoP
LHPFFENPKAPPVTHADFSQALTTHFEASRRNGKRAFIIFIAGFAFTIEFHFLIEPVLPTWSSLITLGFLIVCGWLGCTHFNTRQRRSMAKNRLFCGQCGKGIVPLSLAIEVLRTGKCPHCGYVILSDLTESNGICPNMKLK